MFEPQTNERKQPPWPIAVAVWLAFYGTWLALVTIANLKLKVWVMMPFLVANATLNAFFPMRGRTAAILVRSLMIAAAGVDLVALFHRFVLHAPFVHWFGAGVLLFYLAAFAQLAWFLRHESRSRSG